MTVEDPLSALRLRYRVQLNDHRDVLAAFQAGAPGARATLHHVLHAIAGSAGIFGHAALGTLAADADEAVRRDGVASPGLVAAILLEIGKVLDQTG